MMETNYYPFKVGQFNCIAVSDGRFNYPVAAFFGNAPEAAQQAGVVGLPLEGQVDAHPAPEDALEGFRLVRPDVGQEGLEFAVDQRPLGRRFVPDRLERRQAYR